MGPCIEHGHVQHFVAPAGTWKGCSLADSREYVFLCEVVAPGFDVAGVEFVTRHMLEEVADADVREKLAGMVMEGAHEDGVKQQLFDQAY